jgi:hypothetical protein
MEKMFPRYGKNSPIFPQYGRYFDDFSMLWKNFSTIFHTMEKLSFWGVFDGFEAVFLGC